MHACSRIHGASISLLLVFASPFQAGAFPDLLASWDGAAAGEQFGIAIAIGGDANDDGWADLVIGASGSDENGQNAGKVSIFFGRATPNAMADVELFGQPDSFFGSAVAWAGDVNQDGYDDLLVGAWQDPQGGVGCGKVYLFLGGSPMSTVPHLVLLGPEAGSQFGRAVCGAGDINGDGHADFAVGAPRTVNGTVFVYFGGPIPDGTPDRVLTGEGAEDRFGYALAGPGNADPLPGSDLLVGAPRRSTGGTWRGAAYLFSGGAGFDAVPDWTVLGAAAGDQFGTAVAAAGDVNGDGGPDLLIGAPYANTSTLVDSGAAYLFYGGAVLDATADLTVNGTSQEENLGRSVAGCGDVTGSGYGHFLIGIPGSDQGGIDAGRVILSPGGNPPLPGAFLQLNGEAPGDQLGFSLAPGPVATGLSFTGESKPDCAAGSWNHNAAGRVYLHGVPGTSTGIGEPGHRRGLSLRAARNPASTFELWADGWSGAGGEIRIHDVRGALVRVLQYGGSAVRWDGRTDAREPVPCGTYYCVLGDASAGTPALTLTLIR